MPPRPHAQSQGTLYRAGPGRIRVGKHLYGHWFDGDGAVRQRRDVCALRCGDC
jgi:carotenoid cleavage dioxygenase-like enzyme